MTRWNISGWRICKKCGDEFFAAKAKLCPFCKSKKYSKKKGARLKKLRKEY